MGKACELLRETEYEIKDIVGQVGLTDIYHFSKLFKKETGVPPGQYRKQSRRW